MSKPEPIDTYYYVDDYVDEVLPCDARLDAWAEWLSKPDEDWPHDIARDGEVFAVTTMLVIANLTVRRINGEIDLPDIPDGGEFAYLRHGDASTGWDADLCAAWTKGNASEARAEVLNLISGWLTSDEEDLCLAITADGPRYMATFRAGPPPSLTLGTTVQ